MCAGADKQRVGNALRLAAETGFAVTLLAAR
jgi:hypothetical protein